MKKKLIAGFLVAGSCLFAAPIFAETRFSVGVGVGVPVGGYGYAAPAPAYVAPAFVAPPAPRLASRLLGCAESPFRAARGRSRVLPPVVKPRGVTNPENGFLP